METIRRFVSTIGKCPIRIVLYPKDEIRQIIDRFQAPDGTYKAEPAECTVQEVDTVISDEQACAIVFSLCSDLLTQIKPAASDFFVTQTLEKNVNPSVAHIVERSIFGMWLSVSEDITPELIRKAKQFLRETKLFTDVGIDDLL